MQRRLDVAELAAAVAGEFRLVLVATQFEIVVAVGTSYVAVAPADADAAVVAARAVIAASACADAGCAFDGASAIRREADYPVRRERCLDDRQQPPEVCNWHRRWGWTDVRWELVCVPCDPYRCSETSTCNRPCRPYFRVPVDADSRPRSACRSDCTGETSDKAYLADLPWFHNDGRILLDVTNSGRRGHRFAETAAGPIVSAEVPVRPHRSAADADADVPPRHFAGPGYTNSRSTNSCYCPTCPTCLCHFSTLLADFPLVIFS